MALPAFGAALAAAGPTLSKIGTFAGGLGSLASGLGIGGGGSGAGAAARTAKSVGEANLQNSYASARNLPKAIVKGAKRAGLHPLAVLGSPVAASQGVSVGGGASSNGFDPASIGQGIDRALNAGRSGVQRKLDELALEKAGLENDYLRTQIAGSQRAITNTAAVPSLDSGDNLSGITDFLSKLTLNKIGLKDGVEPLMKALVDQDGQTVNVLNADATGDNEILMLQNYLTRTLPDQIGNYYRRSAKQAKRALTSKKSPGYKIEKFRKKYFTR